MIAVIFEVIPQHGQTDAYLDAAAHLRPLLGEVDGFISKAFGIEHVVERVRDLIGLPGGP